MDKAKITKPIQPSRSDSSGPTEILPSKHSNQAVDTKHQFAPEEIVVPPEMPKATLTIIRPTTVQEEESFTGRTADLRESMKDKTDEAIDSTRLFLHDFVPNYIYALNY